MQRMVPLFLIYLFLLTAVLWIPAPYRLTREGFTTGFTLKALDESPAAAQAKAAADLTKYPKFSLYNYNYGYSKYIIKIGYNRVWEYDSNTGNHIITRDPEDSDVIDINFSELSFTVTYYDDEGIQQSESMFSDHEGELLTTDLDGDDIHIIGWIIELNSSDEWQNFINSHSESNPTYIIKVTTSYKLKNDSTPRSKEHELKKYGNGPWFCSEGWFDTEKYPNQEVG